MKKKAVYIVLILVVLLIGRGVVKKLRPKPKPAPEAGISVRVGYARMGSMASTIEVSGDIKALKTALLSAKAQGRVTAVPYREGDSVGVGTAVVTQDTSDLAAGVRQAEAGLLAAKARLSQATTSEGLTDTQTEASIAQAQAALDSANANLRMIKSGARTQERAQAENAVASAEANFKNGEINLKRMRDLYSQGALSKQQMDLVQMQYDIASSQYDSARQQLSLVKEGARPEEIESAQKQVAQAEEALRIAKSNRSQKALRQEDIKATKAGVAQADAALSYAKQQLANAYIRTPIAGTVSKRAIEPGEMAGSGTPLVEVVALNTLYFEAAVSEMDVDRVKVGQPVEVTVDALPGRKFQGSVQKILPTADEKSRQFTIRIAVANAAGDLRPGMFARGSIEVARHRNTVIIPKDALMTNDGGMSVYLVVGSAAKLQPVTTGFETREEAEATSGVSDGDELVIVGQDKLSDGVKVHVAD